MLDNMEGAIKNGQTRETRRRMKIKNSTQYVFDTTMRKQTQLM